MAYGSGGYRMQPNPYRHKRGNYFLSLKLMIIIINVLAAIYLKAFLNLRFVWMQRFYS